MQRIAWTSALRAEIDIFISSDHFPILILKTQPEENWEITPQIRLLEIPPLTTSENRMTVNSERQSQKSKWRPVWTKGWKSVGFEIRNKSCNRCVITLAESVADMKRGFTCLDHTYWKCNVNPHSTAQEGLEEQREVKMYWLSKSVSKQGLQPSRKEKLLLVFLNPRDLTFFQYFSCKQKLSSCDRGL